MLDSPDDSFLWRYLHEIVSIVIDEAMSCSIISAKNEIKNTKNKSFIRYQRTGQPLIWSDLA